MILKYSNFFALSDNPFGPTKPLSKISKISVMRTLQSYPLRIYEEPKLLKLYCSQAGPFEQHTKRFLDKISLLSYNIDPPSAGFESLIFLISGYKGTGKTTLVNFMIHCLKKCKSDEINEWHIFERQLKESSSSNDQIAEIDKLKEKIIEETSADDYCCVMLDNLVADAEVTALDLYDKLFDSERIVFLFLITSDLQILSKERNNSRHQITRFKMRELTSHDAVEFVKHRIKIFRDSKLPSLSNYQFFPFDEVDIKESVESGLLRGNGNGEGRITLRQFNVILHNSLDNRINELKERNADFDIAQMPQNSLSNYIIKLVEYYQRMVS